MPEHLEGLGAHAKVSGEQQKVLCVHLKVSAAHLKCFHLFFFLQFPFRHSVADDFRVCREEIFERSGAALVDVRSLAGRE